MKPIQISEDFKTRIITDFQEFLNHIKTLSGNIHYSFNMEALKNCGKILTPVIYFTPEAKAKMDYLVQGSDDEIAWHGLVKKLDEPAAYLVEDIIIYPQRVSGASVYTDQEAYEKWITELPDEQFFNLRMQGHSHVNMGVHPSSTDTKLYEDMLKVLTKIPFYIFMIVNKRHELFVLLYDFEQNIIFETKEVILEVLLPNNNTLTDWAKQVTKHVYKEVRSFASATTPGYTGKYGGSLLPRTPAEKNNLANVGRDEEDELLNMYREGGYSR